MKREEIVIGREYVARVNGKDCVVKVLNTDPGSGGWVCLNQFSNRQIVVRVSRNFKREVDATQPPENVRRIAQALDGGTEAARPSLNEPNAVAIPLRSNAGQVGLLARN